LPEIGKKSLNEEYFYTFTDMFRRAQKLCMAICDSDAGTGESANSGSRSRETTKWSPILRKQCANFAERRVEFCTSRATSCDLVMENAKNLDAKIAVQKS
jgi:hypothetical protein